MRRILAFVSALACMPLAYGQLIDELATAPQSAPDRAMLTDMKLQAVQEAFDKSSPHDSIRVCPYDPLQTCKIRVREYMRTQIVLPYGDKIATFDLGDWHNFHFVTMATACSGPGLECPPDAAALSRVGSLRVKMPGADTSLTVIGTSGRVYNFYVRADSVESPHIPHLVVYVDDAGELMRQMTVAAAMALDPAADEKVSPAKLTKPTSTKQTRADGEYLRTLGDVDPTTLDYDYTFDGPRSLRPLRVFDDGRWTYFQYAKDNFDRHGTVPVVYAVIDGYDTPVNSRVVNGTIIAESVHTGWTIRAGERHLCVRHRDHVKHTVVDLNDWSHLPQN